MAKGTTWANDFLKLALNATAIANIADNAGTSPLTNLYLSLHTADPGAGGSQTTSEIAYTSYARAAVARTTSGFTAASGGVSNLTAAINFAAGTGGSGTATYLGIGTAVSGAGKLLWSGPISPSIVTGNGVTPQISTATSITES